MNVESPNPEGNPLAELKRVAVEVEIALLGTCLIRSDAIDVAAAHVSSQDFTEPFLGAVWDLMRKQHNEGMALSPLVVITRLSSPETVQSLKLVLNVTPKEFVMKLADASGVPANAADYAKLIREMGNRRRLYDAALTMASTVSDPSADMRDAASATSAVIEKALNSGHVPTQSLASIIDSSINKLRVASAAKAVSTGLHDLDKLIGGLVTGDLIVLGGRPSMGKSAMALAVALRAAVISDLIRQGEMPGEPYSVLFASHEMTHDQCVERWLTDLAYDVGDRTNPLEYQRFRPAPGAELQHVTPSQAEAIEDARRTLRNLPIAVDGRPGMTVSEVTAMIRQHKRKAERRGAPLRLVVCDHIGLGKILPDVQNNRGRVDEIGEITSALKACAVNDDLALIACHQLSRGVEGRENKRPGTADFRDSGHIEQDADVMIGLYRDAYYLERTKHGDPEKDQQRVADLQRFENEMEVHVLKCRQGKVGLVTVFAHMGANAIRNFSRGY